MKGAIPYITLRPISPAPHSYLTQAVVDKAQTDLLRVPSATSSPYSRALRSADHMQSVHL